MPGYHDNKPCTADLWRLVILYVTLAGVVDARVAGSSYLGEPAAEHSVVGSPYGEGLEAPKNSIRGGYDMGHGGEEDLVLGTMVDAWSPDGTLRLKQYLEERKTRMEKLCLIARSYQACSP